MDRPQEAGAKAREFTVERHAGQMGADDAQLDFTGQRQDRPVDGLLWR